MGSGGVVCRRFYVETRSHSGTFRGDGANWNERFALFVPTGRAISPITGTTWEGTGVVPDIEVPAEQALERALGLARDAVAPRPASAPVRAS